MTVLIIGPVDDDQTAVSGWIAERNAERLVASGHGVRSKPRASRDELASYLDGADGMFYAGHGGKRELTGHSDTNGQRPLVDTDNVALLAPRWVHAFACLAGDELAGHGAHAGCSVFAGYEASMIVDFDPGQLSPDVGDRLSQAVSEATLCLAQGVTEPREVYRAVQQAVDEALALEQPGMWEVLAQQLVRRLVIRRHQDAASDDAPAESPR